MKLISATSILLISSSGVARALLPPGYEDNMHCPPGSCSLFINGIVGPKHSIYKCYDETTDQTTDAVWTGFRTQVEAPEGWIEDPEECDVAPTPAPSTPTHKNIDKPGGLCTTDSDCRIKIRSAEPLGAVGPRLCGCYAASRRLPFDETEGQTSFRRARCLPSACDRFEAYCPLASNDNGMAECALRPIDTSSTSTSSSSDDSPRSRPKPKKHNRSTTSSSTSTSSDAPPSISKKRTGSTTTSSSTSTSSDESPPSNPIKKRKPAQVQSTTSAAASSDDSSTGIVSPTPAPAPPVQAVAEM
ncbi:hypothetical protein QTG54_002106 [Skeletonema marinoi]|uniref:Uncharacterized protein n=1 Tax=Skeletonema marinoi TaxID=267567 RepID=A0AAD8YIL2_9STRA|nr:hypothetical protein QTG54_002106 [Skeletonema marinoi]